jgi:hypothetical protein
MVAVENARICDRGPSASLMQEADELTAIFVTCIRNAKAK